MPGNELAALHRLFDFRLIRNSSRTVYSSVSTRELLVHKILPKDIDCLGIASKVLAKPPQNVTIAEFRLKLQYLQRAGRISVRTRQPFWHLSYHAQISHIFPSCFVSSSLSCG